MREDEPDEEIYLSPKVKKIAHDLENRNQDFKTLYFKQTRQNEYLRSEKEKLGTSEVVFSFNLEKIIL